MHQRPRGGVCRRACCSGSWTQPTKRRLRLWLQRWWRSRVASTARSSPSACGAVTSAAVSPHSSSQPALCYCLPATFCGSAHSGVSFRLLSNSGCRHRRPLVCWRAAVLPSRPSGRGAAAAGGGGSRCASTSASPEQRERCAAGARWRRQLKGPQGEGVGGGGTNLLSACYGSSPCKPAAASLAFAQALLPAAALAGP